MKPLHETEAHAAKALLLRCTEVLPEGFRIVLSDNPEEWNRLTRAVGSKRLCAFAARMLSDAYRETFSEPFLFSEPCMTFEFRYHLNAYLFAKGLKHVRHVSTLLLKKPLIERKCRSVEIDTNDVYSPAQRIAFRYFFGIRKEYRRTDRDPYAVRRGNRYVRVPFYRLFGAR